MTREGVGSLTLCVNVLEELEEVLSLLQGVRGEINVWHNGRSHDCRDGSQAEEDLGKHLDVFEKKSCVSVKEDAVGECLGDESSSAVMRRVEYPKNSADDEVFVLQEATCDKHMGKHGHHGLVVPRILYGALQSPW